MINLVSHGLRLSLSSVSTTSYIQSVKNVCTTCFRHCPCPRSPSRRVSYLVALYPLARAHCGETAVDHALFNKGVARVSVVLGNHLLPQDPRVMHNLVVL